MPNIALDLVVERVDLVDEGANSAAFIKLYKRKEIEEAMNLEDILAKMKPEHAAVIRDEIAKSKGEIPAETVTEVETLKSRVGTLESELAAAQELADVAKRKDEPDFEEVLKSLDPAVQEVFKSMKLQKEIAEEAVRKAAADKAEAEANATADELKALPVEKSKLVAVIKNASPEVIEVLKAASAALEQDPNFEEVGKSRNPGGEDVTSAKEAWTAIEKRAGEIAAESKISKEAAVAKAIRENPELYQKYIDGGAN